MKKADFVWSIGYQGNTAIVNKHMKSSHRNLAPAELLREGFLRAAFCSAVWDAEVEKNEGALKEFLADFAGQTGISLSLEGVQRLLGVYQVPGKAIYTMQI